MKVEFRIAVSFARCCGEQSSQIFYDNVLSFDFSDKKALAEKQIEGSAKRLRTVDVRSLLVQAPYRSLKLSFCRIQNLAQHLNSDCAEAHHPASVKQDQIRSFGYFGILR